MLGEAVDDVTLRDQAQDRRAVFAHYKRTDAFEFKGSTKPRTLDPDLDM